MTVNVHTNSYNAICTGLYIFTLVYHRHHLMQAKASRFLIGKRGMTSQLLPFITSVSGQSEDTVAAKGNKQQNAAKVHNKEAV